MPRNIHTFTVSVFLFLIFIVGVIQAITELRKGDTIQILDVLEDTFITPVKKRQQIDSLFDKFKEALSGVDVELKKGRQAEKDTSLTWDSYQAELGAEEALYSLADIRKTYLQVNRHRTADTATSGIRKVDSLQREVQRFYNNVSSGEGLEGLLTEGTRLAGLAGELQGEFRMNIVKYPVLVVKNFFQYTIFNRAYLRGYENEMEETSVFANSIRPVMRFLWYSFFNDMGDKAVQGRKGWLFYKPGVEYLTRPYILDQRSRVVDPEDKPIFENAIDTILAFKEELAKRGIDLLVAVVPGKASVYPDLLNPKASPETALMHGHSQRALEQLREKGVQTVDLFTPFAQARKEDAKYGDSLYLSQDTHWKTRGPRIAAREVAARIRQFSWFPALAQDSVEYAIDTIELDRMGDVGVMTALPDFTVRDLSVSFSKEKTICHQVYKVERDTNGAVQSRELYRDDYRRSKILVIGDSFSRIYQTDEPRSAGWISHLAWELSLPLASIVSDGGASTLVRQTLARKKKVLKGKKLVVWEFVERDFRFGAEGWKDIKL